MYNNLNDINEEIKNVHNEINQLRIIIGQKTDKLKELQRVKTAPGTILQHMIHNKQIICVSEYITSTFRAFPVSNIEGMLIPTDGVSFYNDPGDYIIVGKISLVPNYVNNTESNQ